MKKGKLVNVGENNLQNYNEQFYFSFWTYFA